MSSQRPDRFSKDLSPSDDPEFVNDGLRDAITKELQRTDLSADDRKAYEAALEKLNKGQ